VDLNRPLAEYRPTVANGTTGPLFPLGPGNIHNPAAGGAELAAYLQAWNDRQLLARDIFNRLVVATGASATIDPAGTGYMIPAAAPGAPEFDALRYLAQLAVNIVDFIDSDDISTAFVWNPVDRTKPFDAANFDTLPGSADPVGSHTVFGVEKPKLVPNEVYAEVVTNPDDGNKATKNYHVRLWAELLNPATADPVAGQSLTPGAKAVPVIDPFVTVFDPNFPAVRPYQLVVCRNAAGGKQVDQELIAPGNVTGAVSPATNPVIKFDFTNQAPNQPAGTAPIPIRIEPNAGQYNAAAAAAGTPQIPPRTQYGFRVVGPDITQSQQVEFDPKTVNEAKANLVTYTRDPNEQPGQPNFNLNQLYF